MTLPSVSVDTSLDLDRSKLYGVRKSVTKKTRSMSSEIEAEMRDTMVRGRTTEDGAPQMINIFAENYKFQLAARIAGCNSLPVTPRQRQIVSILQGPHEPQNVRFVHFLPEPGDEIPRNAQVFDYDAAMYRYQEKMYERQQFALYQAALLCEPQDTKNVRRLSSSSSSQRTTPRIAYDKTSPRSSRGSLPPRQVQQPIRRKPPPQAQDDPYLGISLTIRKVEVPTTTPRRPKTSKPTVKKMSVPKKEREAPRTSTKRYRSPPPRQSRGEIRYEQRDYARLANAYEMYYDE